MKSGGQLYAAALAPAGYRKNQIYPLPLLPLPLAPHNSRGRRSRKKWTARVLLTRVTNEETEALNWLNSGSSSTTAGSTVGSSGEDESARSSTASVVTERQDEVIALLASRAADLRQLEQVDDAPSPAAALKGLLRDRRVYGDGTAGEGTLATFNDGTVSLPDSLKDAPAASTLASAGARVFLEVPERMKRSPEEYAEVLRSSEAVTPYTCRILVGSARKYRLLCRQLHAIGLLRFTLNPKCYVGIFFVKKKTAGKLRLILDARTGPTK